MQTDGLKQVRELAKVMQNGIFADRETLDDAFNYAIQVATASDNAAAVYTAVHVVLNTATKLIEKECNKEIDAVELHHQARERAYDPDPKQMAAADRFNAAFFSRERLRAKLEPYRAGRALTRAGFLGTLYNRRAV